MRFFITGIGGFVGAHLAKHLLAAGHDVAGLVTDRRRRPGLEALAATYPRFDLGALACGDVRDREAVFAAIGAAAPHGVLHLAGVAFAPRAAEDPAAAFAVNVLGTMHVLDAVAETCPETRVLVAGSADAYGTVDAAALPIDEAAPLRPVSVYGISKAASDMVAFQRAWAGGLAVVRARAFNHTGPGQSSDFVCSDFARQIARIERGAAPPTLRVGNVEAVRDFSDVRDVVRGYMTMWERGTAGEAYNVCSGIGTSIRAIVETLMAASPARIDLVEEASRLRGNEVAALVGDGAHLRALGWAPRIPLSRTLSDLLADWRSRP